MKPIIDLAVICVYNDERKLNQYLLRCLNLQNVNCEKVFIDNSNNQFSSAASALNYGAQKANSKNLLFVHQDIVFNDEEQLNTIYRLLKNNSSSVIGSAGVKIGTQGIFSSMLDGAEKTLAGKYHIDTLTECDVLDECLMACSRNVYGNVKFDEIVCDYWDLYVVDFCLQAKSQNYSVFVAPLNVWHVSPGNPQKQFYQCMFRLLKKYKGKFSRLQTCCVTVPIETNLIGMIKLHMIEKRYFLMKKMRKKYK